MLLDQGGDYQVAILREISAGGDNCSRCCLTGAILGAAHGFGAVPAEWLAKTTAGAEIIDACSTVFSFNQGPAHKSIEDVAYLINHGVPQLVNDMILHLMTERPAAMLPSVARWLNKRIADGNKAKSVLILCTSAPKMGEMDTGVWLEELAAPYYLFLEAGFTVEIASIRGGPIPIDASSMAEGFFTASAQKFMHDQVALGKFGHSIALASLGSGNSVAEKYDLLFLPGGHGTCVDFSDNAALKAAVEAMYAQKLVAAVCHGPTALTQCVKADGTPLVQGLTVTGFADTEEAAVGLTDKVPYLLESKLTALGGKYEKAGDWSVKAVRDGRLVTGQNPQSSEECAKLCIEALKQ
eukprot:NODE_706_length_1966_cov_53.437141_g653_i0.p1 GENE.NODE_706_length_1966_cov_53.437141_g653_i0~~NODE_706_length_1966_cov_53.437141_g653_i0.p1  ORF type:complete len:353 (+),score=68.22 NODE_706_length_1966_cov_53.437141_g653_i0:494-1552(+)